MVDAYCDLGAKEGVILLREFIRNFSLRDVLLIV